MTLFEESKEGLHSGIDAYNKGTEITLTREIRMDISLTESTIKKVNADIVETVPHKLGSVINQIRIFGSCARGDFTNDSDIDVAILLDCDRDDSRKYEGVIDDIATDLAMKYIAIVNFVLIPMEEYTAKKSWYPFYKSIAKEGQQIYG